MAASARIVTCSTTHTMLTATGAPRYSRPAGSGPPRAESTSSCQLSGSGPLERAEDLQAGNGPFAGDHDRERHARRMAGQRHRAPARVSSTASGLNCGATIPVRSCTGFSFEPGFDSFSIIAASESGLCTVLITLAATNAHRLVATQARAGQPDPVKIVRQTAHARRAGDLALGRDAAQNHPPPATLSRSEDLVVQAVAGHQAHRPGPAPDPLPQAARSPRRLRDVRPLRSDSRTGKLVVEVGGHTTPGPSASHLGQSSFIDSRSAARPRASLDLTVPTVTPSENAISW